MERLRFKECENCKHWKGYVTDCFENCTKPFEALEEFNTFKALEEQNRLLKLPCAVGDTVYADSRVFGVLEYEVYNIVINKTITYQCSAYSKQIGDCSSECLDEIEPDISEFGKTVFLTREEAESALKELERGKGE